MYQVFVKNAELGNNYFSRIPCLFIDRIAMIYTSEPTHVPKTISISQTIFSIFLLNFLFAQFIIKYIHIIRKTRPRITMNVLSAATNGNQRMSPMFILYL